MAVSRVLNIFVTVGTTKFDALIRAVLSEAFLSELAKVPAKIKVTIQYGNSSIADILTTSSLASVDSGSELTPDPGLRVIAGRRVYQNKADLPDLDPGKTGSLKGLRLRMPTSADTEKTSQSNFLAGGRFEASTDEGVDLELFPFAPSLHDYIKDSTVVISHAGSGTILDTLRTKPTPPMLIAVPNTTLMDNHQSELAEALAQGGYLIAGTPKSLAQDFLRALRESAVPFPDFEPTRFTSIVDDLMGFN